MYSTPIADEVYLRPSVTGLASGVRSPLPASRVGFHPRCVAAPAPGQGVPLGRCTRSSTSTVPSHVTSRTRKLKPFLESLGTFLAARRQQSTKDISYRDCTAACRLTPPRQRLHTWRAKMQLVRMCWTFSSVWWQRTHRSG